MGCSPSGSLRDFYQSMKEGRHRADSGGEGRVSRDAGEQGALPRRLRPRAVGGRGLVLLTANLWFIFRWRLGGALREKDSTGLWMDQADRASARLTRCWLIWMP